MKNKVILGIDPGLRNLGLAVLSGRGRLLEVGVLTTKASQPVSKSLRQQEMELNKLLDRYKFSKVIFEKTWPTRHRSLSQVHRVALLCRRRVMERRISVIEVPVSTVRKVVTGYGWATKMETAQVIAAVYPELQLYLRQRRAWKTRHFQNLFDAVAVAHWYRRTGGKLS